MRVSTSQFEFAHGKKPRGFGYWAFFFERNAEVGAAFFFRGSYSDAVKAAKEEARRRNACEVFAGS